MVSHRMEEYPVSLREVICGWAVLLSYSLGDLWEIAVWSLYCCLLHSRQEYKEPHDRPHIRLLAFPVRPTRICGWYPVQKRSVALEFSIISVQRKDGISLKWVEKLIEWSYAVRSIIWKFFNDLAWKWMVWIRVGTALPEDVLEQRDDKGLFLRQKASMLRGYLEHSNASLSLVCLIMRLIPIQLTEGVMSSPRLGPGRVGRPSNLPI